MPPYDGDEGFNGCRSHYSGPKRRVTIDPDSGVSEGQDYGSLSERDGNANTEAIVNAEYIIVCVASK